MKRSTAILLAAGRGTRMKTSVSKQYLELQGMPVFLHSLRALTRSSVITDIVVTVSDGDQDYVWDLIRGYDLDEKVRLVAAGGAERFHSVYNGLRAVDWPCDYAFIHDSARAFVDQDTLIRLYETVERTGSAVAGVPSKDTVRITDGTGRMIGTPNRNTVWIVQTPQVFRFHDILQAHELLIAHLDEVAAKGITITDDAMVADTMLGIKSQMVMASYTNIKLTTPDDLELAELILRDMREDGETG